MCVYVNCFVTIAERRNSGEVRNYGVFFVCVCFWLFVFCLCDVCVCVCELFCHHFVNRGRVEKESVLFLLLFIFCV